MDLTVLHLAVPKLSADLRPSSAELLRIKLPEQLGSALVEAARLAFVDGLHVTAAISVAGSVRLALFVLSALRDVPASGAADAQASPDAGTAGAS